MLRLAMIIFLALTSAANAAALYQLTNNSLAANAQVVIREADGAAIPPAAGNADWQAYLVWLAVPNTPDPAPTLPTPPPTTLAIVSTSYASALNGTYAIDPATQMKIQAVSLYIAANGRFPAGLSAMPWPDSSGTLHYFPITAEYMAFSTAIADAVTRIDLGQVPTQPLTIP